MSSGVALLFVYDVITKSNVRIRHMNVYGLGIRPSKFVACAGWPRWVELYLKIREISEMVLEFQRAPQGDLGFMRSLAWLRSYQYAFSFNDGITLGAHTYARFLEKLRIRFARRSRSGPDDTLAA